MPTEHVNCIRVTSRFPDNKTSWCNVKNKNNEKKYEEEIDVRRRKLRGQNMYRKTKIERKQI